MSSRFRIIGARQCRDVRFLRETIIDVNIVALTPTALIT
jgi:hypothetical protein